MFKAVPKHPNHNQQKHDIWVIEVLLTSDFGPEILGCLIKNLKKKTANRKFGEQFGKR